MGQAAGEVAAIPKAIFLGLLTRGTEMHNACHGGTASYFAYPVDRTARNSPASRPFLRNKLRSDY